SDLGDDNPTPLSLLQDASFPLPTAQGMNGTSVQVKFGGTSIDAIMLYESATTVAAILPSSAPTGTAAVTVTYNGQSSAPAIVHVRQRAFGLFSLNQNGNGPGAIYNINSPTDAVVNRVTHAAQPGQTIALFGTGLGAVLGDETQQTFPGNIAEQLGLQILVGGKRVNPPIYAGRTRWPGVDEIDIQAPPGVEGCYVPVAVVLNNITSNFVSMSISSKDAI